MQAAQLILNERILRITVALAEELHFGRAAARLHVSQSALSGAVKNLERDLGVRLFTRTSRHVELTEAGRVLAEEARHLIEEGERTVALVRRSSSDVLGPLCLGYPESIDLRWLCSLLNHARTDTRLAVDLECVSTPANALPYELIKRFSPGTYAIPIFNAPLCSGNRSPWWPAPSTPSHNPILSDSTS